MMTQQLVTSLSPWRTRFDPRPFRDEFVVDKWYLDRFFLVYLRCSCQYHSTSAVYSFIHLSPSLCNPIN